jgi:hypothetical protein
MPAWTRLGAPLPGHQNLGNLTIPVTGLLTPALLTKGLGGFNPVLTNVLVKLNTTGTAGVPRGSLTVPVSPVPNPNDTTLFEQPADPGQKLYLPRYRIVDLPPQQVFLAQGAQDWTLAVDLETFPAPEIEAAAATASPLSHSVSVVLRIAIFADGAPVGYRELPLSERTDRPGGLRAVLRGTDSNTRDQVHLAMTDPQYAAALLVRRVATIAVPLGPVGGTVVSSGQGVLRGTWLFDFDTGTESGAAGADVWWEQMTDVQRQLVPRGVAGIVNLGVVDVDAVTLDHLVGLAYSRTPLPGNAVGVNLLTPGDVFAVRTGAGNYAKVLVVDYGYNLTLRWTTYGPPPGRAVLVDREALQLPVDVLPGPVRLLPRRNGDPPEPRPRPHPPPPQPPPPALFSVTVYTDEQRPQPDPFVFPRDSSVFSGIGGAGQGFGLQRHDLPFGGRQHSYYRDLAQPWVFFYLPDEFRLARRPAPPHSPAMKVQVTAASDTLEATTVALAYVAMPYVDADRLDAAQASLASLLPASLPPGVTGPVLQALQVDISVVQFSLSLPKPDGSTMVTLRDQAIIDLRSGIADSLTMSMTDFRPVYQALFSDTELFRGDVAVRLGGGVASTQHVALVGRISQMAGAPVLDGTQRPGNGDSLSLTLANAIESPVTVAALSARLARADKTFPATVQGLSAPLPAQLPPGRELSLVVAPVSPPLPGSGPVEAVVDLDQVTVQPAADKVWEAILAETALNEYDHPIILEVFASAFAAPPGRPDDTVLELNIDFRAGRGTTVQVTPDQLPAGATGPAAKVRTEVTLHMPLVDWVLNRPQLNHYSYRITVIRPRGSVVGEWVPQDSDILTIQTVPLTSAPEDIVAELPQVKVGDQGAPVSRVQGLLRAATPGSTDDTLEIDGKFGPRTLAAVKAFQTGASLPGNGVVDAPTWRKLLGL